MEIEKRPFKLKSKFKPAGDQAAAIKGLISGIKSEKNMQTLLGVTGSGKTFTMANVIAKIGKPTLILAHNKTLAAQLYEEMREFFPDNRVEYFISYYDYYQPESYLPAKDQYIEKDSAINPRIEMMRHATVASLLTRSDVIVVASVSCIYGMSDPSMFKSMGFSIEVTGDRSQVTGTEGLGQLKGRQDLIRKLVGSAFERNDLDLTQGRFRVKGDTIDFVPGYSNSIIRVEFFGDEVEKIFEIDKVTGEKLQEMKYFHVWPARNYVVPESVFDRAALEIREQLKIDLAEISDELVKHRLKQRTLYDLEMLKETGTCKGIENYSRHFDGRKEGEQAFCLLDYFPKGDFLFIIDESHRSVPQVGGMFNGDRARKKNLIDYGFRLTSAFDNRPLKFNEFEKYLKGNSTVFVSATPGDYEERCSSNVVEQIIRPTGLIDPEVEIRPISSTEGLSSAGKARGRKGSPLVEELSCTGGLGNVVIVHGSPDRDKTKDDDYIADSKKSWIGWVKGELDKLGVNCSCPQMPTPWKPKYEEWKKVFDGNNIDENSILVGTSAGGGFLARWLWETKRKIRKLILVAPGKAGNSEKLNDFYGDKFHKEIKNLVGEQIVIYTSEDDSESHIKSAEEYTKDLNGRLVKFGKGYGHFTSKSLAGKEFPELLGEILGERKVIFMCGKDKDPSSAWYPWFGKEVKRKGFNFVAPYLPKIHDPVLDEWLTELDKTNPGKNDILVGHSRGGMAIMRWLERLPEGKKVGKVILLAANNPDVDEKNKNKNTHGFYEVGSYDFKKIKKHCDDFVVIHSKEDPWVNFKSGEANAKGLNAKFKSYEGKAHFGNNLSEVPELLEEINPRIDANVRESSYGGQADLSVFGSGQLVVGSEYGGQVRDSLREIDIAIKKGFRVLLTTLTKRMAEELTDFLGENGVKCRYMHSEIDTFERTEILRELRLGKFDVLVGINLLREGIDIPEIGFVGVLDADKEGFLRDARSLIQIIGRAARNSEARVVLYADVVTGSIKKAVAETNRRREIQVAYNKKNNIIPKTIVKPIKDKKIEIKDVKGIPKAEVANIIIELEADMKEAAELLDFERAMYLRDRVRELEKRLEK